MLRLARRLLEKSKGEKQQLVAIALRKGKVIGIGRNSYSKTHPWQRECAHRVKKEKSIYLHAEIACLVSCRKVPDTLVVARINKKGELVNSKPCSICSLAISLVNPSMKVIHS
jgi:deoxycytidylate deaminase